MIQRALKSTGTQRYYMFLMLAWWPGALLGRSISSELGEPQAGLDRGKRSDLSWDTTRSKPASSEGPVYTVSEQSLADAAERFLRHHMPPKDSSLSQTYLQLTVNLSIEARRASSWAAQVPESIWLNDVLPYAW